MSGRASNELAKELSAGAEEEFERVLRALTKAVQKAAVEYRQRSGKGATDTGKPKNTGINKALLEQIRRQTERAAG